jgi:hypothetical protein
MSLSWPGSSSPADMENVFEKFRNVFHCRLRIQVIATSFPHPYALLVVSRRRILAAQRVPLRSWPHFRDFGLGALTGPAAFHLRRRVAFRHNASVMAQPANINGRAVLDARRRPGALPLVKLG